MKFNVCTLFETDAKEGIWVQMPKQNFLSAVKSSKNFQWCASDASYSKKNNLQDYSQPKTIHLPV